MAVEPKPIFNHAQCVGLVFTTNKDSPEEMLSSEHSLATSTETLAGNKPETPMIMNELNKYGISGLRRDSLPNVATVGSFHETIDGCATLTIIVIHVYSGSPC